MPKKQFGPEYQRAYYRGAKAYYAKACGYTTDRKEDIFLSMQHRDGGSGGEFAIQWGEVVGGVVVPRLEVFDDAWAALAQFPDVLAMMAEHNDEDMTPDAFEAELRRLGIEDATPYVDPHAAAYRYLTRA